MQRVRSARKCEVSGRLTPTSRARASRQGRRRRSTRAAHTRHGQRVQGVGALTGVQMGCCAKFAARKWQHCAGCFPARLRPRAHLARPRRTPHVIVRILQHPPDEQNGCWAVRTRARRRGRVRVENYWQGPSRPLPTTFTPHFDHSATSAQQKAAKIEPRARRLSPWGDA